MRKSVIAASALSAADIAYRLWIVPSQKGESADIKRTFLFGAFLVGLGAAGFVAPLAPIVDIFALMLCVMIILNDGYDMATAFAKL